MVGITVVVGEKKKNRKSRTCQFQINLVVVFLQSKYIFLKIYIYIYIYKITTPALTSIIHGRVMTMTNIGWIDDAISKTDK